MRADRLVATLLLMQTRGRVTAAELAAELEISVATARRDLEALSTAGVPVYPQPGRGGGWQLVGGARTDLSGLTARESQALFLLAGPAAAASPEVKSALRKLMGALPGTFRSGAEAAADAVVVDPAGWGERVKDRPPVVELLRDAVIARRRVRFTYSGRERLVDPWGLVDKDDVWYLVAGTPAGRRTFRVDRIAEPVPTEEAADRPADLELAKVWDEVVEEIEKRRSLLTSDVVLARRHFGVLRDRFGRHCELVAELPGDRVRARVAAPAPIMIAQELAGWGALVEVESPESVKAELARLGRELITRYAPGCLE
ncbi:Predicted DNA-binding transcriptional regulator YafY, contains an HTH and WYL domains [Amycolatopsis pretoriensis]|uniref:Predicted DNA-binding transcriptional regulator YafY, contains an HTH and WYL domains n=1 Tax=Amycolatopsis pretoriensis TaxID=218821 RepID=A0A1H5QGF4_9PSEU|nr:WYL domain-containing protein [Amycolatopsis pretoriensis]SEF25180.1 Predicted DNA-binding transcriptional regulator YafY, contains an HTH and WYL domains [Amycolatopsis pretoriensis]